MPRNPVDWEQTRFDGGVVLSFRFSAEELIDVVTRYDLTVAEALAIQRPLESAINSSNYREKQPRNTQQEQLKACDDLERKASELEKILIAGGLGGADIHINDQLDKIGGLTPLLERLTVDLHRLAIASYRAKEFIKLDVTRTDKRQGSADWRKLLVKEIALAIQENTDKRPTATYNTSVGSVGLLGYLYAISLERLNQYIAPETMQNDLKAGLKLLGDKSPQRES